MMIEPEAGAAAAVRPDQAAQHADRGRLAAAVGAEKAADLARRHRKRQAVDDLARAVTLVQIVNVDDQFGGHGAGGPTGRTCTGWPGLSRPPAPGGGRASTMKTSLALLDSL